MNMKEEGGTAERGVGTWNQGGGGGSRRNTRVNTEKGEDPSA